MKGINVVQKIEMVGTANGKPSGTVKIVDCGDDAERKILKSVEKDKGIKGVLFWFSSYFFKRTHFRCKL